MTPTETEAREQATLDYSRHEVERVAFEDGWDAGAIWERERDLTEAELSAATIRFCEVFYRNHPRVTALDMPEHKIAMRAAYAALQQIRRESQ